MHVSVPEAARLLRVSENTVRRRLRSGELQGNHVASSGGFLWMVEIPDELRVENTDSGEMTAMKALVARLEAQVSAQQEQLSIKDKQIEQILTAKDKQIEQLHVLLQQAQAALPSPRNLRPWWKWWGSG